MTGFPQITVEEYASMNVNHTLALISITIIMFEYIITFQYEVERFWQPRMLNWAAIFFYVNRYITLLGHIPVMLEYFWTSMTENKISICKHLQSFHQYLAIIIQIVVASMLILRTYALYERSRRVLMLFLGISVAVISIGCWAVISGKNESKSQPVLVPNGCGASLSHDSAVRLGAAWTGMLVFDILVFGMTLYKSLTLPGVRGINLLMVLVRDGSLYFGVMVATNLANIMTFMLGGLYTRGVVTMFTNTMSSILISRLMLNLKNPALAPGKNLLTLTGAGYSGYPELSTVINMYNTIDYDTTSDRRNTGRTQSDTHPANTADIEMIPCNSQT